MIDRRKQSNRKGELKQRVIRRHDIAWLKGERVSYLESECRRPVLSVASS